MSGDVKTNLVLIDTNVWLDVLFSWRANAADAIQLVQAVRKSGCELTYAVHQIKDLFYLSSVLVKQKVREDVGVLEQADALAAKSIAWGCVETVCKNATAIGADESDVWLARKYKTLHDDLEDNLILAAAQRANVRMLVTSDEVLLQKATVAAFTPKDAVSYLELGLSAG